MTNWLGYYLLPFLAAINIVGNKVIAYVATGVLAGVIIVGGVYQQTQGSGGGGGAPPGTANIWVDGNGGSCVDNASPVAYNDSQACSTFDAANDTCDNGDVVLVKAFNYGSQDVTGSNSRSTPCTIQAASGESVTTDSIWLRNTTAQLTLKDVVNDGGVTGHNGGDCFNGSVPDVSICVHGDNIILDNVDATGPYAHVDWQTDNSVWKNSDFGTQGNTQSIDCAFNDQQPITISLSTNLVIDSMNFWQFHGDDPDCDIHLETFRLWDGNNGITISNSYFVDGSGDNTARISSSCVPDGGGLCQPFDNKNIHIINNYFGEHLTGLAAPDVFFGDNHACEGWVIAYNFMRNGVSYNCSSQLNNISVGNMGTNAGGCLFTGTGAVNTSNLWSATSHGTCAGDAWVNGTCTSFVCNYSTYNLAGDGYHLTSTSPSRNAGETTYCNTYTSLLDIDGDARTGNCDAGPDEYIAVEANIWIEAGAGTCTGGRSATPIEYSASASPDRRCGSIDQAWDAMNAGDTARMVEGTYTDQIVSGNKASQTFVIGNGDGDDVIIGDGGDAISCTATGWSALCAEAAFMTLENVTTVASDPGPAGGLKVVGANVTVRNFTTIGATGSGATLHCIFTGLSETSDTCGTSVEVTAANFTFDGGRIGSVSYEEDLTCPHPSVQPLLLSSGGDSATFIGVQFGRYHPIAFPPNTGTCGDEGNGTGIPHLETIRFENVSNTLIRDSVFNGPGDHGSGHMFSSATTSNVTFINNVFEERGNANAMLQCNGCTMTNWNWYYNTFLDDGGFANVSGMDFAGNFGYTPGCGATNVKNVYAGSGSCGTNTYIGGTSFGVDSDGKLQVGSPAIDAAETPGVSDTCTDAATVNSLDREGTVRPQGTICDAGADER